MNLSHITSILDNFRIKLGDYPSRIDFISELSYRLGFNFFVKKDSELGKYGGNKIRKIEFLLKDALSKGKTEKLIVFGPTGSHHVIANLIYGRDFFKKSFVFLFPTHLYKVGDRYVAHNTDMIKKLADKVFLVPNYIYAFLLSNMLSMIEKKAYLVPAGSTSPLSSLGFIFVVDEIKNAVESKEVPEPDFVFMPVGSMGTFAGISLGFALSGMKTKVIGVGVVDKVLCNRFLAKKLLLLTFDKMIELLTSASSSYAPSRINRNSPDKNSFNRNSSILSSHHNDYESEKETSWIQKDFVSEILSNKSEWKRKINLWFERNAELLYEFLGKGYGFPTPDGDRACQFFSKSGLKTERTYTAKTLSAILNLRENLKGKNVLLYYTLNTKEIN